MTRLLLLVSIACYGAACYFPAVDVTEHGSSLITLTGWECVLFLPRLVEGLPFSLPLFLAWLANISYYCGLVHAILGSPRRAAAGRNALLMALGFPVFSLMMLMTTNLHVLPSIGCILWYCSMVLLALPVSGGLEDHQEQSSYQAL